MAATKQAWQFEFGAFRLDAAERLLLCGGQRVPLPPKIFDTLLVLAAFVNLMHRVGLER